MRRTPSFSHQGDIKVVISHCYGHLFHQSKARYYEFPREIFKMTACRIKYLGLRITQMQKATEICMIFGGRSSSQKIPQRP